MKRDTERNRVVRVARARQGSRVSESDYEAVVEQFYRPLYRFGYSLAGNESDAADLTQETYEIFLRKAGQVRNPEKVKSWLFTTLYRQFLDRRRRAGRFPQAPVEAADWEMKTVSENHIDRLTGATVIAALQQVPEKFRSTLALFYLDQLSYREIASALTCPIGTVMSRLSRGKAMLREQLEAAPDRLAA